MALQSSQRLPELLFYTKKSYRILQAPILHVHITLQSREFSIQNPILHAEDKELFEYYYYIQRAKDLHSRKEIHSPHRRQGDLLEMCVLVCLTRLSNDIPDIPVVPDTPETFQAFQSFMTFQPFQAIPVSPGNPPHSSILQLECIFFIFYSSIGFHRKLHRVPVGQLQTLQTFILQRKGDVAISVKLTYSPE